MNILRIAILVLVPLLPAFSALTPKQQTDNVASFEQVWTTVRDRHPDPKFNGLNWQAVHNEILPRIQKAQSMDEVREILTAMLDRLGTSHYGIVPGNVYQKMDTSSETSGSNERGSTGLHTTVIDGKAVVASVDPGSSADRAGIKPGMVVDDVNGTSIEPMLQSIASLKDAEAQLIMTRSVARKLAGPVDEMVNIKVRGADGKEMEAKLEREAPKGELVTFANLPPVRLYFESRKLSSGAGYISFNFFLNPVTLMPKMEQAMAQFAQAPGVILDLRGNPGGIGFMATGIAGFFVDKEGLNLGEMKTHDLTLKFAVFPRPDTYAGPLAVLVDGGSASTSEIFAGGMQDIKRAKVFGSKTAGAALPSDFMRLANGDGFQFAMATYTSSGGKVLEGNGVVPDVEVKQTQSTLASGTDPVLLAAEAWIQAGGRR